MLHVEVWKRGSRAGHMARTTEGGRHLSGIFHDRNAQVYATHYSDVSSQPVAVAGEMRFEILLISPL